MVVAGDVVGIGKVGVSGSRPRPGADVSRLTRFPGAQLGALGTLGAWCGVMQPMTTFAPEGAVEAPTSPGAEVAPSSWWPWWDVAKFAR